VTHRTIQCPSFFENVCLTHARRSPFQEMLWKGLQLFSPVTKRRVEHQVLKNTHIHHLFQIIQDVDQYSRYVDLRNEKRSVSCRSHPFIVVFDAHRFLPLCSYSQIIKSSTKTLFDGRRYFEATLTVGIPPVLQETYVSAVYIHPQLFTVETKSLNGQKFDALQSFWQLKDAPGSDGPQTEVHFTVEMTVSDPLIAGALDRVLESVAKQQVQAFAQRCQEIPYVQPQ
jgi:ribosome-associated toxin RatA of RatAB toxin-antitoxin module